MSIHIIEFTVPGEPRTARPRACIRGDKPGMHKDRHVVAYQRVVSTIARKYMCGMKPIDAPVNVIITHVKPRPKVHTSNYPQSVRRTKMNELITQGKYCQRYPCVNDMSPQINGWCGEYINGEYKARDLPNIL